MGNQVALAVPDVKPSLVVEVLAADNSGDFKIGLFIPSYALALIQSFTMLLFVQNAKQLISKGKAQIGKNAFPFIIGDTVFHGENSLVKGVFCKLGSGKLHLCLYSVKEYLHGFQIIV